MNKLIASIGLGLCALASPAFGVTTVYTDPTSFNAALGDSTIAVEGYETGALNQLITSGSSYNGVTYTFSGGRTGQISNTYNRIGTRSLEALGTTGVNDFFLPGQSINVTFMKPLSAIGGWFNVGPSATDALFLMNAAGASVVGGGPTDSADFSTLYFLGIISDTPFNQASFGTTAGAGSGFNFDNLTSAGVPEPATWATMIAGFALVGLMMRRRRRVQAPATA